MGGGLRFRPLKQIIDMHYPLQDLRVLDFSRVLAGPYASRMLADLGAEVLKVEPPEGDLTRKIGIPMGDTSSYYIQHNVGKRNICIDLRAEGASELVLELAKKADIVIENFRPGVMDRRGLGWEALRLVNPRLVMLSISGYGQTGPERDRGTFAPLLHAESGLTARQSLAHGGSTADITLSLADSSTALHGLVAVLTALRHVERTGEGQHIDMAMLNALHATDDYANLALADAWSKTRQSDLCRIWDAPENCKIAIAGPVRVLWPALSAAGDLDDPAVGVEDVKEREALQLVVLEGYLQSFPSFAALTAKLNELKLLWGRVRGPGSDTYEQPSIESRGVLVKVSDGSDGEITTTQSPYKFSGLSSGVPASAKTARTGEDNGTILGEWLGCDTGEILRLVEQKILIDQC